MSPLRIAAVVLLLGMGGACAHQDFFPGTTVPRTPENKAIIDTIELYRARLLEKNVDGLLVLASPRYFEDSGTQQANDDYGYDGLRERLGPLLERIRAILRYEIQYRAVNVKDDRAEVDVFINSSFEMTSELGDRYHRVNDKHKFVLERSGENRWKFLSGM